MGSRLLRQWLVRPLIQSEAIHARLDAVGELKDRIATRVALRTALRAVQDLSRLSGRIVLGVAGPRELVALKDSLATLPEIITQLSPLTSPLFVEAQTAWDNGEDLHALIEKALQPEVPITLRDGGVIRDGYQIGRAHV